MTILCNWETYFIAKLINNSLNILNISSQIMMKEPKRFDNRFFIVISPQKFKKMPEKFIAFQTEQTIIPNHIKKQDYEILQNAFSILDYSTINIMFFKHNTNFGSKFYYLPIDYLPHFTTIQSSIEYDVIFYGSLDSLRKKQIIKQLEKHFSVTIVSKEYGNHLYQILSKAKIIVNIHSYNNSLLETCRLYEILSIGQSIIISEKSHDSEEEKRLENIVDFIDNISTMINHINYWLTHENERLKKISYNKRILSSRGNAFDYFFFRFLLANNWLSFGKFYELAGHFITLKTNWVCLSLPENLERRRYFDSQNKYGFEVVPALRYYKRGWTGCGMSYKFMIKKAQTYLFETILICEDDVVFPPSFKQRLDNSIKYLSELKDWDIFQGLMSRVNQLTINHVNRKYNETFIHYDHLISTVFNYYHQSVFPVIINWSEKIALHSNNIDRYLGRKNLKNIITLPYLVGHNNDLYSTLWGYKNVDTSKYISNSQIELGEKLKHFDQTVKSN